MLEAKWSLNVENQNKVSQRLDSVGEAVEQLKELKTMVLTLQTSDDEDMREQIQSLLAQADAVAGNAAALEAQLSFQELTKFPEYQLPMIPSAVSTSEN